VKDGLTEAHAELQTTGYLAGAAYAPLAGGPRAGEKVVYAVQPAFDRRPRRRAGSLAEPHRPDAALAAGEAAAPEPPEPPTLATFPTRGVAGAGDTPAAPPPPAPSPVLAELVAFGVSPARAAALVAGYPEAHITSRLAYVRELLRRPGATPVKNPAGYLARAIEQGYALPDRAPAPPPAPPPPPHAPEPAPAAPAASAPPATADAPRATETPAAVADDTPWGRLAAALKERLSAASYAAWVLPAGPAGPAADGESPGSDAAPDAPLVVLLPSAFALDRWRRPPLAPALRDAAASLGLTVVLEQRPAAAEEA
jgi:hypothetical protein